MNLWSWVFRLLRPFLPRSPIFNEILGTLSLRWQYFPSVHEISETSVYYNLLKFNKILCWVFNGTQCTFAENDLWFAHLMMTLQLILIKNFVSLVQLRFPGLSWTCIRIPGLSTPEKHFFFNSTTFQNYQDLSKSCLVFKGFLENTQWLSC